MRRSPLTRPFIGIGLAAVLAMAGVAHAAGMPVHMDQSVRIALRGSASSVVVGNPAIADVNVIDAHTILVLGKGYGVTNLVVLDRFGRVLFNREIVVSASDDGRVSMWRGATATSYACSPRCEREPTATTSAAPGPP